MTEFQDPIQRLIDADPVRTSPRDYPNVDRVLRRALVVKSRPRVGAAFRAQVASAVLGASLLTGAGITALQSAAPTLPVLALSSSPSTTNASDSKVAGSMLRPMVLSDLRFDGSALSDLPSQAPVWKVTPPEGLKEFQQIADALGLEGPVSEYSYENTPGAASPDTTYSITDPNRGTLTYSASAGSGVGSWWFSADNPVAVSSATSSNSLAAKANATSLYTARAIAFVASLRLGYHYSNPDVYLYDSPDVEVAGASASFTMLLEGLTTNIGLYVSFDAAGHVTSASGSLGHFERVGNYPLTGVTDGVARLQDQNNSDLQVMQDASQPTDSGASTDASDGVVTEVVPAIEPTVVHVGLTSVQVQLQLASVGGDTYLVPYYIYGGTANSQDSTNASWDGTWSAIAVSSEYITLDMPKVMPMAAR